MEALAKLTEMAANLESLLATSSTDPQARRAGNLLLAQAVIAQKELKDEQRQTIAAAEG